MEIVGNALHQLLKSFPPVELSYEITKQESPPPLQTDTHMSLHIPFGPKYFAWFWTGTGGSHGVYLMEWSRQKRIDACRFHKIRPGADLSLFYGTILYGTWASQAFVMEDIYYYKGQQRIKNRFRDVTQTVPR